VYGKAGCGKTILCYTAIEDMRTYRQNATNTGHAISYFSFSDDYKQTYQSLLVSLAVQLGKKEPGLPMLRKAYEEAERRHPGLDKMEEIPRVSIASYDEVVLQLDALDECPERDGVRQNVLRGIKGLLDRTQNVRMLVTTRYLPEVRDTMEGIGAEQLFIPPQTVNADIGVYVSTRLSHDTKLSRLDNTLKTLIEERLAQKADGLYATKTSYKPSTY
jgi:ankyrin repeat domain-containing protein 50